MRLKDLDEEAQTKKLRSELGLLETTDGAWSSRGRRLAKGLWEWLSNLWERLSNLWENLWNAVLCLGLLGWLSSCVMEKWDSYEAEKYRCEAKQGNVDAQNNLGVCYAKGEGVEQSFAEAAKWFRKSAEQGNADARDNLCVCLCDAKGEGVAQFWAETAQRFRGAAERGNADAQNSLGWCYEKGLGVERSQKEAAKWFHLAAQNGYELSDDARKVANEHMTTGQ